jgi:hypothetical protein
MFSQNSCEQEHKLQDSCSFVHLPFCREQSVLQDGSTWSFMFGIFTEFWNISVVVLKSDKINTVSMENFISLWHLAMIDLHNWDRLFCVKYRLRLKKQWQHRAWLIVIVEYWHLDVRKLQSIHTYNTRSKCRKFYREVRRLNEGYHPQSMTCNEKEGSLVGGKQEVLHRALEQTNWQYVWFTYSILLFIYFLWHCSPAQAMASSSTRFLDHTVTHHSW